MPRWTLQFLQHIVTATTLLVITNTSRQDHLFLSWSYTRPAREIIYRTVRGKLVRCGYKYKWDTPITIQQIEEGATWTHTFHLTNLLSESRLWYYLHAPCPPSEWETQGPLQMIDLLHAGPPRPYLYFASRYKGMFRTTTFSGPDEPPPVWVPDNEGLLSLYISQAALDPFIPEHRRYLIAGPHLYRHFNDVLGAPANAITILTWPEALALTGATDGTILWVEPNRRHPGMLHVLFSAIPAPCAFWHLRTLDYGEHWTAHLIHDETGSESAGNIMAGFNKGTSPYGEGDVVYVPINLDLYDTPHLARSFDQGATWQTVTGPDIARTRYRPRIHVDPANQSTVYIGCHPRYPKLYRSEDHGDTWARVDREENETICLNPNPQQGTLRSHEVNPLLVRQLHHYYVLKSEDYCASWTSGPAMIQPTWTFRFTTNNPNLLYLAKDRSATLPPPFLNPHVIFITDDEGLIIHGKSGANCHLPDGGGDSIPYNCGGAAFDGILIVQ